MSATFCDASSKLTKLLRPVHFLSDASVSPTESDYARIPSPVLVVPVLVVNRWIRPAIQGAKAWRSPVPDGQAPQDDACG